MSKVKILDRSAAVSLLFGAMCKRAGTDVIKTFSLEPKMEFTTAEVVVTVNGVEVDFIGEVAETVTSLSQNIDDLIKAEALKLWESKAERFRAAADDLARVADDIEALQWKARQVVEKLEQ